MGCEQMNDTINTDTLLPVGERLKPLLSKSCISESDMKNILAERGVYIGDSDKKSSIPILTLSILSPREFEKLQELQKTKEDSLKTKIIKAKSQSDKNEYIKLDRDKSTFKSHRDFDSEIEMTFKHF